MKVFEEIHGKIFVSEEEKDMEEYARFLGKNNIALSNTEAVVDKEEDILDNNTYKVVNSNCKSKTFEKILFANQNEKTKDTSKKLGRKIKELTGTGIHGKEKDDDQRDSKIRFSVKYLIELASGECKKCKVGIFKKPNIKQQYGSSFIQNISFLNTRLYKILCFQRYFNDGQKHRDTGLKNKKIIMKMLGKKNNKFFISLMKLSLIDYEKIEEIIRMNLILKENDEKKLITFIEIIKSLINDINHKFDDRRKDQTEIKKIDYITIEELDD